MFSENQGRVPVEKCLTFLRNGSQATHIPHLFQKVRHPIHKEKLGNVTNFGDSNLNIESFARKTSRVLLKLPPPPPASNVVNSPAL